MSPLARFKPSFSAGEIVFHWLPMLPGWLICVGMSYSTIRYGWPDGWAGAFFWAMAAGGTVLAGDLLATRVEARPEGIRIRRLLGTRRISWEKLERIGVYPRPTLFGWVGVNVYGLIFEHRTISDRKRGTFVPYNMGKDLEETRRTLEEFRKNLAAGVRSPPVSPS